MHSKHHEHEAAIDEKDEFSGDDSMQQSPNEPRSSIKQNVIVNDFNEADDLESLRLQSMGTYEKKRNVDDENLSVQSLSFGLGQTSNNRILNRGDNRNKAF